MSVLDAAVNTRDIWVFDISRGVRTRVTFDPSDDVAAAWSPDSTRLVFASNRAGHFDLYRKAAAGIGNDELIFQDESEKYPTAWSPDGRSVLYWTFGSEGAQVRLLTLGGRVVDCFRRSSCKPGATLGGWPMGGVFLY